MEEAQTPKPQRAEIRCENLACRRAVRVLAVPVPDGQGLVWVELRIRGGRGAKVQLIKICPWCRRPLGRMTWSEWRTAVFREQVLKRQAARTKDPLPDVIVRRAAAIRRTWRDPEVWAAHARALGHDASRRAAAARKRAALRRDSSP